jgi:glycosyltransferase involved in cell wall biosynthesis
VRTADSRVRFLGACPFEEVLEAQSKADVFLFPSRYDIFGLVLVEAMGAGSAVVVSQDVGAVADLCVDGNNCMIVGDHDPDSWAKAIARLATDAELRSGLGVNARATIGRRWTIEHAADAMLAGLRIPLLAGNGQAR